MSLAVQQSPTVKFSATVGTPNIAFGVEGKYKTASSLFMEYNAAISVKKQNTDVSISLYVSLLITRIFSNSMVTHTLQLRISIC